MIATRPQFHWTDQKLRVHAFLCVMAYLLCRWLWWRYRRHDDRFASPRALLAELKKVRLAQLVEMTGKPGRPRLVRQLEALDPQLERTARLCGALPSLSV